MQPLPLGRSTFSALRMRNEAYVDKTALVHRVACGDARVLLRRPRRFGKSLLLTTFESLFRHGLRDFRGLALEAHWRDRTYAVVRLDLSALTRFESSEAYREAAAGLIAGGFWTAGFRFDPASPLPFRQQFRAWLLTLPKRSLVVLVDEYDAPVTANFEHPERIPFIREALDDLYAVLKDCEDVLRFLFITGITRLGLTPALERLLNFSDASFDPQFAALFGWTRAEVEDVFAPHLDEAARRLGLSHSTLLDVLEVNYSGWAFDREGAVRVFSPWAVLNFLRHPGSGFLPYWFMSGGTTAEPLIRFADHLAADPVRFTEGFCVQESKSDAAAAAGAPDIARLMLEAGCLTFRRRLAGGRMLLGWPCRDVEASMAALVSRRLLRERFAGGPDEPTVVDLLAAGRAADVVRWVDCTFAAADCGRRSLSAPVCRALLQIFLEGGTGRALSAVRAEGEGRLEVEAGGRRWMFAIAATEDDARTAERLDAASTRLPAHQDDRPAGEGGLHLVSLVFNIRTGRVIRFHEAASDRPP